jgi:hypothetical protein
MRNELLSRRTLVTAAIAFAVAAGSVAGTSLAQGDGSPSVGSTVATAAAPGGILAGVHDALARLVADGTITQSQADAVQEQANAGSINPKQLVDGSVLSDAQMRTVAASIDQLKRANG